METTNTMIDDNNNKEDKQIEKEEINNSINELKEIKDYKSNLHFYQDVDFSNCIKIKELEKDYYGIIATRNIKQYEIISFNKPMIHFEFKEEDTNLIDKKYALFTIFLTRKFAQEENKDSMNIFTLFSKIHPRNNLKDADKETILNYIAKKLYCNSKRLGNNFYIYYLPSFFNHSCFPKCVILPSMDGTIKIISLLPIRQGEELTINYTFGNQNKDIIRDYLLNTFGFNCECPSCRKIYSFGIKEYINGIQKSCIECSGISKYQCPKCKVAHYCSKECQKLNWKEHKIICSCLAIELKPILEMYTLKKMQ